MDRLPQQPGWLWTPRTDLIGRDDDIAAVGRLLRGHGAGLVTVTGSGGVGKTQLALRVVDEQRDAFDEILLVDLSTVDEASYVLTAMAHSAGVRTAAGPATVDTVARAVGGRRILLMLDNVEHVIDAAVEFAALLARCPGLTMLVTSREPLKLRDERVYPLAPLRIPASGEHPEIHRAVNYDAIRLFLERARSVQPDFTLTANNVSAVVDICRRLDGVPLAIELAARRVNVLPPKALQIRLEQVLPILSDLTRDVPQRQRTIWNTIRWSYDLLNPEEQRFLRCMVVFSGGFSISSASFVANEVSGAASDTLQLLMSLVDKNLIRREGEGTEPRFFILETIRQFGAEELRSREELDRARDVHARWYAAIAAKAAEACRIVVQFQEIQQLEQDHANIRAALGWLQETRQAARLSRIVADLGWFWYVARHEHEGIVWLQQTLAQDSNADVDPELRGEAAFWEAMLAQRVHHPNQRTALERARRLAEESGNARLQAEISTLRAIEAVHLGDYGTAKRLIAEAESALRPFESPWHKAHLLFNAGCVSYGVGDLPAATRALEQARVDALEIGDEIVATFCLRVLSLIASEQGHPAQAAEYLQMSIDSAYYASTPVRKKHSWPLMLECTAVLAGHLKMWESVARLQGAATADSRAGVVAHPEKATFDRAEAMARRRLGEGRYQDEAQLGATMQSAQLAAESEMVFAEARRGSSTLARASSDFGLTPREREVLQLMVAGKSNPEIADALFVTVRTAKAHVSSILMKFDVESRTAAVTFAHEHGLV